MDIIYYCNYDGICRLTAIRVWGTENFRSLRGADHSSRGVLPTVVRRCVWSRNLVTGDALAHWGLLRQKRERKIQKILGAWFSLHSQHLRSQRKGGLQFAREMGVLFTRYIALCRSRWPCGSRCGSEATRWIGVRVRITLGAWMSVSCEYCVLSGRGLCDVPFTRPDESYQMWCA
jgi:hypothetical protein